MWSLPIWLLWKCNKKLNKVLQTLAMSTRAYLLENPCRIGNMGFMIWVFIYCQSCVRIPGFWLIVWLIMVYKTLYSFCTFANVETHAMIMAIAVTSLLDKVVDTARDSHRLLWCRARQIISSNISALYQPLNFLLEQKDELPHQENIKLLTAVWK